MNCNLEYNFQRINLKLSDDSDLTYDKSFPLEFGFDDLNLHRIYLSVFKNNERAISAYRKCGFAEEGVMREAAFIDGQWLDVALMGLINDQR